MSDNKNGRMTKADVILLRLEKLTQTVNEMEDRVTGSNNDAAIRKLNDESAKLKQEIRFVSAQLESVCTTLAKMLQKLPEKISATPAGIDVDDLSSRVAAKIIIPESSLDEDALAEKLNANATPVVAAAPMDIDYEALGYSVAKKLYVPQAIAEEVDYDKLADKVAGKLPPVQVDYDELGYSVAKKLYVPQAIAEEIDYDALAEKVAARLPAPTAVIDETAFTSAEPVRTEIDYDTLVARISNVVPAREPVAVQAEIDYDTLAEKLAGAVSVQEPISPDYIAAKVAEQIIIPETQTGSANIDVEELSRKVADKIVIPTVEPVAAVNEERLADMIADKLKAEEENATPATVETRIDEQALAEDIASRLNFSLSDELIADAVVKNLAGAIDSDEIADCVAKRVGSISPEQFEITVDDDGCDSLADAIESKLDYDYIAAAVAEKVTPAFMAPSMADEIDAEDLARQISEKLSINADINEDVLADKAAAVLSNYLPEIDSDDIADKVIAGIIPALPATPVMDGDAIAASVTEKLVENQESGDYDIVIDEEGLGQITENVSQEIIKENSERFDKVEQDIAEIKDLLLSGAIVAAAVAEPQPEEEVEEEVEEETPEKVEEELVEEVVEEAVEEPIVEEPVEEEPVEEEVEEEVEEPEEESDADGDVDIDVDAEGEGGVDFASMMKFNRSFIARIIQGSDDQKNYYGQVKTALLSYKKVNSNVAWGAERFNKGRETIARFKIRGKTLCLYLALDPNDYATSVYHHVDATDNKSMRGTPMMVKIKSPLGVKKAVRLIDEMMLTRGGERRNVAERDYAAMYPYETMDELIEDGLVKDLRKK